jgi:peptidyl-prolyl cis-trans isomerase D
MISFFRRILSSWAILGLLGLIMIAFIVTGVGTPSGLGNIASTGSSLASVGGQSISTDELGKQMQRALKDARKERPGIDMAIFAQTGAYDSLLNQLINTTALDLFGKKHDMAVSKRMIDAEIAGIPAFNGPTGKFDHTVFENMISQQGMNEAQFRDQIRQSIMMRHLIMPVTRGSGVSPQVVMPYASLMLERRTGIVAAFPSKLLAAGPAPTALEVSQFYQRNAIRYTVPELRSIRYTLFDRSRFEGKVVPTEAEIAAAYQKDSSKYAARDLRGMTQIIVADQATAGRIATQIKAGTAMAAAAKSAGLDTLNVAPVEKKAFAAQSSEAVAKAAFGLPQGGVSEPVKSGLGWHIVRVDSIKGVAGQSLAAVRSTLVAELTKHKVDGALADFVAEIEDNISAGQTFDDVVKAKGLTAVTTPELTAGGIAPSALGEKPNPILAPVLKDAFQAEPDDDAAVVTVGTDSFALYDLDKITSSAPRPLALIKDQVASDFAIDRGSRAAKKIAEAVAAKANAGTALSAAISGAGVALPAPRPISVRRIEVEQAGDQAPMALSVMFRMVPKRAKVIEMPDKQGWFVVWLDKTEPGDAATQPQLIEMQRRQMADQVGDEYTQQFATAVKAALTVKRDDAAIASFKRSLSNAGSGTQ